MKKLLTAAALTTLAQPAFAHVGDHSHEASSFTSAFAHLLSSPFHVALIAGAIVAGGFAIRMIAKKAR